MILAALSAFVLVAITVTVHAFGLGALLSVGRRRLSEPPTRLWPVTRLLIKLVWYLILFHMIEILMWGMFYYWRGCLPDAESAFYFSGVSYSTIGYGDLVLQKPWRMLGPVEGVTGILMCGLSASFFFAVVSRMHLSALRAEGK